MSSRSQKNIIHHEIPGTISIISRQNTLNNPSLVQDVWEFEHDPDDQYLLDAFNRQSESLKRHSYQEIHISGDNKHRKLVKKNNTRKLEHSSEVTIQMEKRNQYGLIGSQKMINDRKTVNKNKKEKQNQVRQIKYKDKKSQNFYREIQNHQIKQNGVGPSQDISKQQEYHECLNRDIDILQRKNVSNANVLINQTKQLINMNKQLFLDIQREEAKKMLMKLQIEVRKLKISLRSNNSSKLNDFKRYSEQNSLVKKKKSLLKSFRSQHSEKQEVLMENIVKEKKKTYQLSTRQSILYNYYNVIKSKPELHDMNEFKPEKTYKQKKYSTIIMNYQQRQNHHQLLKSKRDILLSSVREGEKHVKKKCEQIVCEKKLLKDQISIVESKIKKLDDMNVKYKLSPTKSRLGNVPKKSTLSPNFQPSKSKRKLNIKSISQDKEETYFGSPKSKNYNIERVKSHKQMLWGKDKVKKISPNRENEYFINTKYFRYK